MTETKTTAELVDEARSAAAGSDAGRKDMALLALAVRATALEVNLEIVRKIRAADDKARLAEIEARLTAIEERLKREDGWKALRRSLAR